MNEIEVHDTCLVKAFRKNVLATPYATALRAEDGILTYLELDLLSDVLASDLRLAGCQADSPVMLRMHRAAEMVIAIIAILKAGGAYLPVATDLPLERASFIQDDARPICLLERGADALEPLALDGANCPLRLVDVDDLRSRVQNRLQDIPTIDGDQLAYILYTSGSTGQPKGCLLEHKALRNRVWWMHKTYPIDGSDAVLQKTPYTFDVSVWEFLWPLAAGARLVLAPPDGHKDPAVVCRLIEDQQVTVCHFVPSMLRQFLRRVPNGACASLRHVFLSGEALQYDLMLDALKHWGGTGVHNLYGPTEAAIDVSYFDCAKRDDHHVPIGQAIDNVDLHILDASGSSIPSGTIGELYIAGAGLARGYLNRPDLTEERFPIINLGGDNTRVYRTGDLAEVLPDGMILFHGRTDNQIKLRGQRIELGEVEAALTKLDDIDEAVVLLDTSEEDDPRLVAYCVGTSEGLHLADIRKSLLKSLPANCLPNRVQFVPRIPITAHGKADRQALLGLQTSADSSLENTVGEPTTTLPPLKGVDGDQIELLTLCRDVLQAPDLKPEDDFFDLGATSFTLLKLGEQIDAAFGVDISVETFLADPSVNGLLPHVGGKAAPLDSPDHAPTVESTARGATDKLLTLCRDVLQAPDLKPEDDFFDLGATSFTLLKLGEQIDAAFGVDISVETFLVDPSVNGLLPHVEGHTANLTPLPLNAGSNHDSRYLTLPTPEKKSIAPYCELDPAKPLTVHTLLAMLRPLSPMHAGQSPIFQYASGGGKYPLRISLHLGQNLGSLDAGSYEISGGQLKLISSKSIVECLFPRLEVFADLSDLIESYGVVSGLLATLDLGYLSETLAQAAQSVGLALSPAATETSAPFSKPDHWVRLVGFEIGVPLRAARTQDIGDLSGLCRDPYLSNPPQRHGGTSALRLDAAGQAHAIMPPDVITHVRRQCRREYLETPVSQSSLSSVLGFVAAQAHEVDIFVHIKEGRTHDVEAGLYRYDAKNASLTLKKCGSVPQLRQGFYPFNRKHFDSAAVTVLALGKATSINLEETLHKLGRAGQKLLESQPELGIGICPIGWVSLNALQEKIPALTDLKFLHGFTLGSWDFPELTTAPSPKTAQSAIAPQVAIVGMSGRYGNCVGEDAIWSLCEAGGTTIRPLPEQRKADWLGNCERLSEVNGSALDRVDMFDADLFGISPPEARSMDPQERIVLEEVYLALENAGHDPKTFVAHAGRVGVFIGAMWQDYAMVASEANLAEGETLGSAMLSSVANHVAHRFGFNGPALAIDTGCSSALSALDQARRAILSGQCDSAIVAGISLCVHPYHRRLLNRSGLLANGSDIALFGTEAKGWVLGEGAGALVIRKTADAEADGNPIRAIVSASTTRHRGTARLRSMPDGSAQQRILNDMLHESGLSPAEIDFVEAAAAGAAIADAVEISSLKEIATAGGAVWPVGSSKVNFGHTEAASGILQVIKTVRQLESGRVAPLSVGDPLNSKIPFKAGCVYPAPIGAMLPPGRRRGLINGFSAEGVCAHAVLESTYDQPNSREENIDHYFPISARDKASLREHLRGFVSAISTGMAHNADLSEIARTLQSGRVALRQRVVIKANCRDDLIRQAAAIAKGELEHAKMPQPVLAWVELDTDQWPMSHAIGNGPKAALPARSLSPVPHWMKTQDDHSPVQVAAVPVRELDDLIDWLVGAFATSAEIDPASVTATTQLTDLGISSILIARMVDALAEIGLPDSPTSIWFNADTLTEVAEELVSKSETVPSQFVALEHAKPEIATSPKTFSSEADPIAIVGLSGRWPGADTLEAFWDIVRSGKSVTGPASAARGDWAAFQTPGKGRPGRTYTTDIGEISEPYRFDASFFGMTPREAETIDPQERLFLETAWSAIEDAGIAPPLLHQLGQVGVFAGVMNDNYERVVANAMSDADFCPPQTTRYWSIANRVSFHLNFNGPSLAVDTACSSSLSALHLASQSIESGEIEFALAGGVNLLLHPGAFVARSMLGMLSPTGKCSVFGSEADGTVVAEGCGVVLLAPLSVARRHGCQIHGLLRGSAMNSGGRTNGYTMPNAVAQGQLINSALRNAGLSAADISYVEAHGTGTILGDPVEFDGLRSAFSTSDQPANSCALGSVKLNIGHAESAAGMAALTKVLLQMRHRIIVPGVVAGATNVQIETQGTVFRLQQAESVWEQPAPSASQKTEPRRRGGISSFGAGGANAHIVIEEPPEAQPGVSRSRGPRLFVLSARTATALKKIALQLQDRLRSDQMVDLDAVADTLCVGRTLFAHRAAIWADTCTELQQALVDIGQGSSSAPNLVTRVCETNLSEDQNERIRAAIEVTDFRGAAEAWMQASMVDWNAILPGKKVRISLPSYPFEGEDIRPGQIGSPVEVAARKMRLDAEIFEQHKILDEEAYAGIALIDQVFQTLPVGMVLSDVTWHALLKSGVQAQIQRAQGGEISILAGERKIMTARPSTFSELGDLKDLRADIMSRAVQVVSIAEIYEAAERAGTCYGPEFMRLSNLMIGEGHGFATVEPTKTTGAIARAGMLDAGLQAAATLLSRTHNLAAALVPISLAQFRIAAELPDTCHIFLKAHASDFQCCDILYCAPDGQVVGEIAMARFAVSSQKTPNLQQPEWASGLVATQTWQGMSLPRLDASDIHVIWILNADRATISKLERCFPTAKFVLVTTLTDQQSDFPDLDLELNSENHQERFDHLIASGLTPDLIVTWDAIGSELAGSSGLEAALQQSFYAWIRIAGLLAKNNVKPRKFVHLAEAPDVTQKPVSLAIIAAFSAMESELAAPTGHVVLIPPKVDPKVLVPLFGWAGQTGVYRYHDDQWQRQGLQLVKPENSPPFELQGLQVVTGGLGCAARALVGHLLENRTGTQFLLIGRRTPDAELRAWLDQNEERVTYAIADCSQIHDLQTAIEGARLRWGKVRGVFHTAGINTDQRLSDITPLSASKILAPKLFGFEALDTLTADDALDHFTIFSSLAAEAPQIGQTAYGFANRALMNLGLARDAHSQSRLGKGATRVLMLPFLHEGGMVAHPAVIRSVTESTGISGMDVADIGRCCLAALGRQDVVQAIMPGDPVKIGAFLARVVECPVPNESAQSIPTACAMSDTELAKALLGHLKQSTSLLLGIPEDQIEVNTEFSELGMDSVLLTQWATSLSDSFGWEILPTEFFDGFTLQRLVEKMLTDRHIDLLAYFAVKPTPPTQTLQQAVAPRPLVASKEQEPKHEPLRQVNLIGVACRMPGANTPHEFWELMKSGRNPIETVPESRWANVRDFAGLIGNVRRFDARFFGLSPMEVEQMDPQQRHLLEVSWQAFEDAGIPIPALKSVKTGVFIGASTHDYADLSIASGSLGSHSSTGTGQSFLANRLSYMFDLKGPSQTIDTACSSSLVALTRAIDALRAGRCDLALVAGVNLMLTNTLHRVFDEAGMLSPRGRCATFDASADGYVRAEGISAVVLSVSDLDGFRACNFYGQIIGAAENHGGRAQSLTAPNPQAQAMLLREAYLDAGIDVLDVDYVETHGTGTSLGDPIEVEALKLALGGGDNRSDRDIRLGALKSQVGHMEAAAGIGALIKAALCLRHSRIPANCNFSSLNPLLRLNDTPFKIQNETSHWVAPNDRPRRAGVSAFGIGGSNAHVVLQDDDKRPASDAPIEPYLFVISAKTETALQQRKDDIGFLLSQGKVSMRDLSFTFAAGREHFDHRWAVVTDSQSKLATMLTGAGLEASNVKDSTATLDWAQLDLVGRVYLAGQDIEFLENPQFDSAVIISVPTYPFEGRDYWLPETTPAKTREMSVDIGVSDPILSQHVVAGVPILPGMAGVTISRYLLAQSAPAMLRDVRWERPVQLTVENGSISIELETPNKGALLDPNGAVAMRFETSEMVIASKPLTSHPTKFPTATDLPTPEVLYEKLSGIGLNYGRDFQVVSSMRKHGNGIEAILSRPDIWKTQPNWAADAVLLDGALHLVAAYRLQLDPSSDHLEVPTKIAKMQLWANLPDEVLLRLEVDANDQLCLNAYAMDGSHVAAITGFQSKQIDNRLNVDDRAVLLRKNWVLTSLNPTLSPDCERVIILDNNPALGKMIESEMPTAAVRRIGTPESSESADATFDPRDEASLDRIISDWNSDGWYPDLVIHNLASSFSAGVIEDLETSLLMGVKTAFATARVLMRLGQGRTCRFIYVYSESEDDAIFAATTGLAQTVCAEQQALKMSTISLAGGNNALLRDTLLHTPHGVEFRLTNNEIWTTNLEYAQ